MNTKQIIENIINDVLYELTAYHASPNNFSKFSISQDSKGIGYNPLYGYGIYVTTNKENALSYIKKNGYIYIVEIPDDINDVYLDLSKKCPTYIIKIIVSKLYNYINQGTENNNEKLKSQIKTDFALNMTYKQVLDVLGKYMDEKHIINNILIPMKYVGIKYTPNTNLPNVINYVIFKSNNIKIIKKTKI